MYIGEFDFEESSLEEVKKVLEKQGGNYILNESEDNSDDFVQFFFVGDYQGKEMLFDVALYTLQIHHESELYDLAERKVIQKFPEYKALTDRGVEVREGMLPQEKEDEIGVFMMETMMDLEEEEAVKVKEHIEVDEELPHRIGLDVSLNVPQVTPAVIERFVADYKKGSLKLDPTLYSFQSDDDDD